VLLKRGDVAPPASPDAHSRRIVVALRAGSQIEFSGIRCLPEKPFKERETSDG
jgi:hypothetical protein